MELQLVKPKMKSLSYNESTNTEVFEIGPFEPGQAGGVFGNSLRTTLMSHIPGYAVTNFQIGSRKSEEEPFTMKSHIFDTISGVTPDLVDIHLRIKRTLFKLKDGTKEVDINIIKKGPCVIKAGDFATAGVTVLNPDHELLKIVDKDTEITFSLKIKEGRGYIEDINLEISDWIAIDGIFSPVLMALPEVENASVNGVSGYEKLKLTIRTNEKLTPKETLDVAIRIIQEGYNVLKDLTDDVIENESIFFDVQEEKEVNKVVYKNIEELGLSVRAYNALMSSGVRNTGDFERYTEKQIRKIDNLGKKTFEEIKKKLVEFNIELKKED